MDPWWRRRPVTRAAYHYRSASCMPSWTRRSAWTTPPRTCAGQIVFYAIAAVPVGVMAFALMHPGCRAGEESPTERETEGGAT